MAYNFIAITLFLFILAILILIANGDYIEKIFSWIKLQWKGASPLKRVYIIVAGVVGFALLILFVHLYLQIFLILSGSSKIKKIDANFALAFLGTVTGGVALFSGFLAILRSEEDKNQNEIAKSESEIADKQAITAEQGLITDRINKAIEGLGKFNDKGDPIIEVRIGALYALERIAQDSFRDHMQIMEILCAYIRHASLKNKADKTEKPTEDIQAALTIIGRRNKWPEGKKRIEKEAKERYCIDLADCYLYGAKFGEGYLVNATLVGANLSNAWFNYTDLSDSALGSAILVNAWFERTTLKNTEFRSTTITTGAHARNGDFSNCLTFTPEQIKKMFFGAGVKLADGLDHPQEGTDYYKIYDTFDEFYDAYSEWKKTL